MANDHRFIHIKISGIFPTNTTMITPTALDISLLPLSSNNYEYAESMEYFVDKCGYKNMSIELTDFDHHLLTFGIYGLVFDSLKASDSIAALFLVIFSALAHFIYNAICKRFYTYV